VETTKNSKNNNDEEVSKEPEPIIMSGTYSKDVKNLMNRLAKLELGLR
jgi:hypothetical protein